MRALIRNPGSCLPLVMAIATVPCSTARLPICLATGGEFEPEYEKAELHGPGDTKYSRVGVKRDWRGFQEVHGRRIAVEEDAVLVLAGEGGEEPRRVSSVDGRNLRWLGAAAGIALFVAENTWADVRVGRHYLSPEIRRLDLESLSWLPSWIVAPESDTQPHDGAANGEARRVAALGSLLANDKAVVVLTYTMAEKPQWPAELRPEDAENIPAGYREWLKTAVYHEPLGYRVTCFDPKGVRPRWSKSFSCAEGLSPPAMLSADVWDGIEDQLELLTWLGGVWGEEDAVLVCAGEKQDLVCLVAGDGWERWRIPRLWEYERGYIGPSVFEYFVERFGLDYTDVGLAEETEVLVDLQEREYQHKAKQLLAKARKRFEESHEGWIAAGPVVVPGDRENHIFVAAARRRKNEKGAGHESPEQCTVYELETQFGEILGATALPRLVEGRPFQVLPGALIWSCTRGCLVRLHHYEFDFSRGFFGPGWGASNEALCRVAWYREYLMRVPPSWFWADPPHGVAAFGRNRLFRPGAAYVRNEDDKVYRFHINVVDLETGMDHDLTLAIPFRGGFPMPEHGYAKEPGRTHATQPHLLGIADLSVQGNVLRVIINRCVKDGEQAALEFDLAAPR